MSEYLPCNSTYEVRFAENGLISHWTSRGETHELNVYEGDTISALNRFGEEIASDVTSLMDLCYKEDRLTHFKVTLLVESLREEGGDL